MVAYLKTTLDQINVKSAVTLKTGKNRHAFEKFIQKAVVEPYVDIAKLEGKVISYKSLLIEWCQKEKKSFHYDVFDDNGNDGQKYFGVKLSIDNKVIAKARATSKKKAEEKASQRAYFVFQEKINNK